MFSVRHELVFYYYFASEDQYQVLMKIWKNILVNFRRLTVDTSVLESDTAQVGTAVNFKSCIGEVHGSNLRHVTGYIG